MSSITIRMKNIRASMLLLLAGLPLLAQAGMTSLADTPLAIGAQVKPNIAFVVDDSGSMAEQSMPLDGPLHRNKRCWGSHKFNTLFYNPATTYVPPYKVNGAVYPTDKVTRFQDADFNAALADGYFPAMGTRFLDREGKNIPVDLAQNSNLTPDAVCPDSAGVDCKKKIKYYYSTRISTASPDISAPGICEEDSRYEIVTDPDAIGAPNIPALPQDRTDAQKKAARTNYANWYSYYRNRASMMKQAAAEAFKDLDESKFRLGLFFINSAQTRGLTEPNKDSPNSDLKIADFSGLTRATWFERLYAGKYGGGTPLRGALSRMGQMFGGVLPGWDPVQYSCQQNFTILSTDGYWNASYELNTYGPFALDNKTPVGDVDGAEGIKPPYRGAKGNGNTLADIAYYYYTTDLRTEKCTNSIDGVQYTELCKDNVRGSGKDTSTAQHMTTFTIGLGVSGDIVYENNYEQAKDIPGVRQYIDIVNGTDPWPATETVIPAPDEKGKVRELYTPGKIDDLWHAAVNGRGTYYSSTNAQSLREGILSALAGIEEKKGAAAPISVSNPIPVSGDNLAYAVSYLSSEWSGDVTSYHIDLETGAVSDTPGWSAQKLLDARRNAGTAGADDRTIKYFSAGATNKLKDFTFENLTADTLMDHFDQFCKKIPRIDQCGTDSNDLNAAQQAAANSSRNLINYLRGQETYEIKTGSTTGTENWLYRGRNHILGDIINASPLYAKVPPFNYEKYDPTYGAFKRNNINRGATLYVGANDGMLHAFDAVSGRERWAYVPTAVMPNMWHLAGRNYAANHRYLVDGSPVMADVCARLNADTRLCATESDWKSILVGGLNKGGCSYYALDVTDPAAPKGLWEFKHPNLGFSYGAPIIAKRGNGKWVVIVSSGYNNVPGNGCSATGDGNGHVFVLDALSGEVLEDINTHTSAGLPAGSVGAPSGLANLNAWIEDAAVPVVDRVYGGDLLGNVWRIDIDARHLPHKTALRLAQLVDSNGIAQPVTTTPQLTEARAGAAKYPLVLVGTGRYLGQEDRSDINQQSVYALKDALDTTGIGLSRGVTMQARTLNEYVGTNIGALLGKTLRGVNGAAMDWANHNGWYLDFNPGGKSPGERVNVDMILSGNTLSVAANVPSQNACELGGHAYLYFLDINTGLHLVRSLEMMAGLRLEGNALVAGITAVKRKDGREVVEVIDTAAWVQTVQAPPPLLGIMNRARRTAWREIQD
ncbi:MAG: pilus assembly protein PilY [Herminiimonas sp.]|nr:pilus assembly protein PilY [Herminiimonas sp.]